MELISSRGETSSWKEFAQADAGLPVMTLEIALSGVPAKVQPLKLFQPG
jgi:hypothetical protein